MYIALISLHALIMVVFHFLYCFEDDWTSEYSQVLIFTHHFVIWTHFLNKCMDLHGI